MVAHMCLNIKLALKFRNIRSLLNEPSLLRAVQWLAVKKLNSGALVLQRTIPTERPPLVGEVSANFSG
jgi:hypothetical protein